ncbi:MAG: methylated-DNA--[protein]-cysteine S-methyltransferase [Bacilli bacterium]
MILQATYQTAIGKITVGYEADTLFFLSFSSAVSEKNNPSQFSDTVYQQIKEYLAGERKSFQIKYQERGTEFQMRVWSELKKIPYGETRTYKEIAVAIGNSKAARAVGMACNRNPLPLIIPCHRVIGAKGKLVGFALGLNMKEKLINLEKENS